jgi:hypothetical protein
MAVLFEVLAGSGADVPEGQVASHPTRDREPDPAGAPLGGAA